MYQPWPDQEYPPSWRVALAFLLAPGAAALLMAIAMPMYAGLPSWIERVWRTAQTLSVFGAYPITVALGLPAYFMLRRHFAPRPFACAIVGFVISALPWAFLVLAASSVSEASINGRATVVNGHTTAYGWLQNAEFVLTIGFFGAAGGLVFWAVAAAGHGFKPTPTEQQANA